MKRLAVLVLLVAASAAVGGTVWYSSAQSSPEARSSESVETFEADHFSVDLPTELRATVPVLEDGRNIFVFESADGAAGFQVFTMAYSGPLTPDALKAEIPDLAMNDVENVTVGVEPALAFDSHDGDIGDTFEVWFVRDGVLYQVMTYRSLDAWLRDILATWRFR